MINKTPKFLLLGTCDVFHLNHGLIINTFQKIAGVLEGKGKFYIVQSRPITTLEKRTKGKVIQGKIILEGMGASPGIGVGVVKIIKRKYPELQVILVYIKLSEDGGNMELLTIN